jgi:hypothetical protein
MSVTAQHPAISRADHRTARGDLVPGDGLLHPAALLAIALLLVNDHLLKPMLPSLLTGITGKLSDLAGLLVAPLVAVAAIELAHAARGRRASPGRRFVIAVYGVISISFIAAKTTALGAAALGVVLGFGQWAGGVALAPLIGAPPPAARAVVVVDPTDLIALLSIAAALTLSLRRRSRLSAAGWQ